jgi:hypothetical protein
MSALGTITAILLGLSAVVAALALFERQILRAIRSAKAISTEFPKKKLHFFLGCSFK